MPLNREDVIIFGILLLSVPFQYIIVKYWSNSELGRTHALNQLIHKLGKFQTEYLEWESWKIWCSTMMSLPEVEEEEEKITEEHAPYIYGMDPDNAQGESPAIEVLKYKQNQGFFALSQSPRTKRSPQIRYKIGQVVVHKFKKYRGVIIGWDETARAPEDWLQAMHGDEIRFRNMPNYAVLVDIRDRMTPQITYVPEENLNVVQYTKIMHPLLDDHFETFDGTQYTARPWLKAIYPQD